MQAQEYRCVKCATMFIINNKNATHHVYCPICKSRDVRKTATPFDTIDAIVEIDSKISKTTAEPKTK